MLDIDDGVCDNLENYDFRCENSFWKHFVLCEHVENNLMVNELDYGLEKYCSRKRTQQTIDKHDYETEVLRKTTTIDGKLKRPVVKLAPMFYECVFRESSAGKKDNEEHAD